MATKMRHRRARTRADVGMIGLAVMGRNLALNMADHGFCVAAYDREAARTREFVAGNIQLDTQPLLRIIESLSRKSPYIPGRDEPGFRLRFLRCLQALCLDH